MDHCAIPALADGAVSARTTRLATRFRRDPHMRCEQRHKCYIPSLAWIGLCRAGPDTSFDFHRFRLFVSDLEDRDTGRTLSYPCYPAHTLRNINTTPSDSSSVLAAQCARLNALADPSAALGRTYYSTVIAPERLDMHLRRWLMRPSVCSMLPAFPVSSLSRRWPEIRQSVHTHTLGPIDPFIDTTLEIILFSLQAAVF